ncbi:methyltransferase domain-containing protein [Gemmata sp. SH-PL17]|uniref:methyltransferase domain-containing protein n=1 Tax=Gemmata sp. SH-PL17 TaxID=1630693 RepID=UPI00194F1600|nr:methyltransferase domain-containing protein [Gemmata sp. SH-PL17]
MFLSRLHTRDRIPELMDDPAIDPAEHRRALAGLVRLNRFSNSVGVLWPALAALSGRLKRTVRVLDVATGSGDVPRKLLARAERAGVSIEVAGCDVSPTAIEEASRHPGAARFFVHDALRDPLPNGFDVVTCSLFLHHLSEDDAITLLANMKGAAGALVLVNDLLRSRFNYCAVWAACRVLTGSRVVWFDGPASVRSAFTPAEALALAERAGLHGATARSKFPSRFLLSWSRSDGNSESEARNPK